MIYEVQTLTCFNRWENVWTDDGNTLVTFDTLEAAQKELAGFLEDLGHFVKIGHLQDFSPEDYRIVEVTA
tara:strand:+ start:1515 stop:1724 length:210 start_codon:yes stop_codon:yes gene_type:complete